MCRPKYNAVYVLYLVVMMLLLATAAPGSASDENSKPRISESDVLNQVRADWRKRREEVHSVRYTLGGTQTFLKETLALPDDPDLPPDANTGAGLPEEDYTHDLRILWRLDFQKSRIWKEEHTERFILPLLTFAPRYSVAVAAGGEFRVFEPREMNTSTQHTPSRIQPDLNIFSKEGFVSFHFTPADYPVFFAHGLYPVVNLDPASLPGLTLEKQELHWKGWAMISGRRYALVQVAVRHERFPDLVVHEDLAVDLERHSAVGRWERSINGSRQFRVDIEQTQYATSWFPDSWSTVNFRTQGNAHRANRLQRLKVEKMELNPLLGEQDFELPLVAEMLVDNTMENRRYRVSADGRQFVSLDRGAKPARDKGVSVWEMATIVAFIAVVIVATLRWRASRAP